MFVIDTPASATAYQLIELTGCTLRPHSLGQGMLHGGSPLITKVNHRLSLMKLAAISMGLGGVGVCPKKKGWRLSQWQTMMWIKCLPYIHFGLS